MCLIVVVQLLFCSSYRIAALLRNLAYSKDCKHLVLTVVSLKVTSGLFGGQHSPANFVLI